MAFTLELESGVVAGDGGNGAGSSSDDDPPLRAYLRRHGLERAFVRLDGEGGFRLVAVGKRSSAAAFLAQAAPPPCRLLISPCLSL